MGTVRKWPALDDVQGTNYAKQFVLRGVGDNVEVWVAKDLAFPAGDCRNEVGDGEGIVVTDEQVASFVEEFDENIYPKESLAFSTPPPRDGSITPTTRAYAKFYGLPARNFKGKGDRIVTLVDNVRDSNYYTPQAADGKTYIAGFHYSLFSNYTNRNVMTLDAWDWTHRTGDGGEDNSADTDYVACSNFLGRPFGDPRPLTYEGTFAHEYQHLLEYYASPGESSWINEGLSDWSQTLVGYVDPSLPPDSDGDVDGHLQTWMGFADDASFGGPEQSLTRWEDQGAPEILADYGIAYAFQEYLWSHFGEDKFMSALHNEDLNGFAGLDATLKAKGFTVTSQQVVHDFLASMALDQVLDSRTISGATAARTAALKTSSMNAKINWDTPQAYDSSGAPTNGADYVKVTDGAAVTFDGAEGYQAQPVEWKQDGNQLYSGSGDDFDRAIARKVTVPTATPTMTFDLEYQIEPAWDFAFVQVYDTTLNDGEGGWVSLSNDNTTDQADPDADPSIVANLPGLTGDSGGATTQSFTVPAKYTGKEIWVAVRYMTDGAVAEPGVWLSGMTVGGQPVADATTLASWTSLTGAVPVPVSRWTVQLVGWNGTQANAVTLELTAGTNTWTGDVSDALGFAPIFSGFIVTANDPTELVTKYAGYSLTQGGTTLPGGGAGT